MNNLIKNLIRKGREVSLTKLEKTEIRRRIVVSLKGSGAVIHMTSTEHSWKVRFLKPVFVSAAVAVLLSGGVSFASENTLPGDLLYSVKVNVNEKVRAALASSDQAKAEWETTLADRRLEETEKLAAKGDLSEDEKNQAEERFTVQAERAKKKIAALEAGAQLQVAAEVGAKLEGSLKAHGRILKKLNKLESVVVAVNGEAAVASTTRVFLESKMNTTDGTQSGDFKNTQKKQRDAEETRILIKARQELKVDVNMDVETNDDSDSNAGSGNNDTHGDTLPAVKVRAEGEVKLGL